MISFNPYSYAKTCNTVSTVLDRGNSGSKGIANLSNTMWSVRKTPMSAGLQGPSF